MKSKKGIEIALKNTGVSDEPCRRCGKTPRMNYKGLCMDCADELGISELFPQSPEQYNHSIVQDMKKRRWFYLRNS